MNWESKKPEDVYRGNCYHPREEYNAALEEWGREYPGFDKYRNNNYYIKIVAECEFVQDCREEYERTLALYRDISSLNITPALVKNIILHEDEDVFMYGLVTERYGESLKQKYCKGYDAVPGPDSYKVFQKFDCYFLDTIPLHVREQVKVLIIVLLEAGWVHCDLHAGNFVIDEGVVKIIDFDMVKKS